MNTILIVDASDSESRLMSGLLGKSGYIPIAVVYGGRKDRGGNRDFYKKLSLGGWGK